MTETMDHKTEYAEMSNGNSNGSSLSRQVTVTLTPEQYERMFFSPSGPKNLDLQKRFGNPTLLGLLSFLIPYSSTIFVLIGWGGAVPPTSLVGLSGDYYFLGCIGKSNRMQQGARVHVLGSKWLELTVVVNPSSRRTLTLCVLS